jgi:two-component system nitrogen regulation sensor histidine kinase NtrY
LVVSFNRMTQELLENKIHIEAAQNTLRQTNVELETRRRYIETILQTITTGVISLDSQHRIRTMNPAAAQMLNVQNPVGELALDDVVKGEANETLRMLLRRSVILGPIVRNIELALPGKILHLATTVTPFADSSGQRTGWVVVLDDLTELLRVEKMTAWQEVARRLAHEIKNPLTPIQLSAERILGRYKQIMEGSRKRKLQFGSWPEDLGAFENLLDECVRTITHEAGSLKKLVDEFSRFARLPDIRLEDADLHQIIDTTISLYHGRSQDLSIEKAYDSAVPRIRLDPEQMKRVFINLIDNALEAMAGNCCERKLQIRTSLNTPRRAVRVEISDTGRGFPEEYQDSLFLPYFSTRKGGTGLGLAIVRQIVTDHHGFVHAEPNAPQGTKIVIDLPLAQS